jgi:hypothetical protein
MQNKVASLLFSASAHLAMGSVGASGLAANELCGDLLRKFAHLLLLAVALFEGQLSAQLSGDTTGGPNFDRPD